MNVWLYDHLSEFTRKMVRVLSYHLCYLGFLFLLNLRSFGAYSFFFLLQANGLKFHVPEDYFGVWGILWLWAPTGKFSVTFCCQHSSFLAGDLDIDIMLPLSPQWIGNHVSAIKPWLCTAARSDLLTSLLVQCAL